MNIGSRRLAEGLNFMRVPDFEGELIETFEKGRKGAS
jgi:hypothetical protein